MKKNNETLKNYIDSYLESCIIGDELAKRVYFTYLKDLLTQDELKQLIMQGLDNEGIEYTLV